MKLIKRIFIAIAGGTVLLMGIAMTVLPVPSLLVILAGLAILAIEFAWAQRWLQHARRYMPGKNGAKPVSPGLPAEPVPPPNVPVD